MHRLTAGLQWPGIALFVFLLSLSALALAQDRQLAAKTAAASGTILARYLEDRDHLSIIELSGNYDRFLTNGGFNQEPRELIAKEFFSTHADNYDFLIVFSTFEFETGEATAFHLGIQNQVEGIGLPLFDHTELFGSNGRLQGYIDMAALDRYEMNPLKPGFETTLATLNHEILHQWAAYVRFPGPDGAPSDALLGHDDVHWSFLLDTDASVMYGNDWRDNNDGSFTSVATRTFFSPLDLYLAGFFGPDEVPPFLLIDSPETDKHRLPEKNVTVEGLGQWLTVDDVIAVEGPRYPPASEAQKDFRAAFVLLIRPGETVTDEQIAALTHTREGLLTRFTALTGGRGLMQVYPETLTEVGTGSPAPIEGGETRPGDPSITDALAWLRSRQTAAGFWEDIPATRTRDTTAALTTLTRLDPLFEGAEQALTWLVAQEETNTDFLARKAVILDRLGQDTGELRAWLTEQQNSDGGWGLAQGYRSDPLDTALVLQALAGHADVRGTVTDTAVAYLLTVQAEDGGWGSVEGGPGRTVVTGTVLQTLAALGRAAPARSAALVWLAGRQQADGGFGDNESTAHATAIVLSTLLELEALAGIDVERAAAYLRNRQTVVGSWEGSVYTTALVATVLKRLVFPNWAIVAPMSAVPERPRDGERVEISITVNNDGHAPTPAGVLRLYDGDPDTHGVAIGADYPIPALAPLQTATVKAFWDTLGQSGSHTLVAVIDPDDALAELSELDNRAAIVVEVAGAAAQADLELRDSDITIFPAQPQSLPADLAISVTVRNLGLEDVSDLELKLWQGTAEEGILVGQTTLAVPARSSTVANFSYVLAEPGATGFTVQADPENLIAEADETNNQATASVSTLDSIDLEVRPEELTLTGGTAHLGSDAGFRVMLHNRGTLDSPSTQVRYRITNGSVSRVLGSATIQPRGGETLERTVIWRVDLTGELRFVVELDPAGQVLETDETNNTASLDFTATTLTEPNLVVDHRDISFAPEPGLEGKALTVAALVRNTGGKGVAGVPAALYEGDPQQGGSLLARQEITHLDAGGSVMVNLNVPQLAGAAERLLFVAVDPDNTIAEFSEDDNTAFKKLEVLGMADPALGTGSLSLAPRFPQPGQGVALTVRVANLGEQVAENVTVRAYDGDPANGGQPVGADQSIPRIEGSGSAEAVFTWTYAAAGGVRLIVVHIDPEDRIAEASESNNTARLEVAVGDGNFFVSNRYFSPNGDGVKDTTGFFFRLQEPAIVAVEIVDRNAEIVRRQVPNLVAVTDGRLEWDGLDEQGRVVRDGDYRFRVISDAGVVLGGATVTVDTNRSSLLAAVGTPFENTLNLTCELPTVNDVRLTGDGETYFFIVPRNQPDTVPGIYRMDSSGGGVRLIVPEAAVDDLRIHSLAVTGDGSRIVFLANGDLWTATGNGAGLRKVEHGSDVYEVYGFAQNGGVIVRQNYSNVTAISLNGSAQPPRALYTMEHDLHDVVFSPDRRNLVLRDSAHSWGPYRIMRLDLETGVSSELLFSDPPPPPSAYASEIGPPQYAWSPDGTRLAVTDANAGALGIYDPQGHLLQENLLPEDLPPFDLVGRHDVAVNPEIWNMATPAWSASGTELALKVSYQDFFWSPHDPYEYNLFSYHTIVRFDLLHTRFESIGWSESLHSWGRSYYVSTWDGHAWVERGVLRYGSHYQEQRLDLSPYLPDADGELKVRIRQAGGDTAHVESVSLFIGEERIAPVSAVRLGGNEDVLERILFQDRQVLDLHGEEVELRWEAQRPARVTLALDAQETALTDDGLSLGADNDFIIGRAVETATEQPFLPAAGEVFWVPDERALFYLNNFGNVASLALLLDENNRQVPLFENVSRFEPDRFTPSGRELLFRSSDARNDPNSVCYGRGYDDLFVFRSLANLTADLRVHRSSTKGGVLLDGTAADLSFSHYSLELAALTAPEDWRPITPPSGQPVIDNRFATWAPPGPGIYIVRLTVEDLAGNRRQTRGRVAWTEDSTSITDLFREPAIISPNGDGVQDEMILHYRVLQPVNLEFRLFNETGQQVRRIVRSHSLGEGAFELSWDGRDDNGLPLPDGEYRLVVQGFELFITLDSTPPEVSLVLTDALQKSEGFVQVGPDLEFDVREAHFDDLLVEIGLGDNPVRWESFDVHLEYDPNDPTHLRGRRLLSIEQFVNHRFRLQVVDTAGNETVVVTPLGAEQLIVNRFGPHRLADPFGPSATVFEPLDPVPFEGRPPFRIELGEVRFGLAETVRADLAQIFIQFRKYPPDTESPPPWFETSVQTFLRLDEAFSATIPETRLEIVWDLEGVPAGVETEVRLRSLDIEGSEHFSNTFNILTDSIQFNGQVSLKDKRGPFGKLLAELQDEAFTTGQANPGDFLLWGIELVAEPLAEVTLYVSSHDDPRYAIDVPLIPIAIADGGFLFKLTDPLPCKSYEGFVTARTLPANGQSARTLASGVKAFQLACLEISARVDEPAFGDCGETPSGNGRVINLAASSLDGVGLALLTLFRIDETGFEDVLFNVNQPVSGRVYSYELDTAALNAGANILTARISNGDGEQAQVQVSIIVDHEPPSLFISHPQQGGRLCGVPQQTQSGLRNTFKVEGIIDDDTLFSYFLELNTSSDSRDWESIAEDRDCYDRFSEVLKKNALCGPRLQGSLATFGDDSGERDFSGNAILRLHAFDWGGHHACTDVSFFFDGEVEGATAESYLKIFSPNGDDVLDQVEVLYQVEEEAFLDVDIHAALASAQGPFITGPVIRHLEQNLAVVRNGSVTWDGINDNNERVADGLYGIVLRFRDGCGNLAVREIFVEVDTTPPALSISYPQTGNPLPLVVEIQGSVEDPHIETFRVDFGAGADPTAWMNLGSGVRNVTEQVLATWNTFGLQGDFMLRLSAADTVGNHDELRIPLNLNAPVNLITYLETVPRLFSPNGDGRKESAGIRFGLDVAALASLTIIDNTGTSARTLLDSVALDPGATLRDWDGRDDSGKRVDDGSYTAILYAQMVGNTAVTQEETVTVVVDSTPPEVEISRPRAGYVSASGAVRGTIRDRRLAGYRISLTDTPSAPNWQELDRGATNRVDYAFGSLVNLAEGNYALWVDAWDEGDSRTEQIIPFVVDNTPPVVSLSAPVKGSILGSSAGPILIVGGVHEINLLSYRVEVGTGEAPSEWQVLASGELPTNNSALAAWNVSELADGRYTLRLLAVDKAGLSSQIRVPITLDNTAPAAALDNLEEGSYLTGPLEIIGIASDANLLRYRLAIAPGPKASAKQWSELGQGEQPVMHAALFNWQALPPDGLYTLRLSVRDGAGNETVVLREINVDLNPPAPPSNLVAVLENAAARLGWQANTEPDLAGYRVFRNDAQVGPKLISELSFLDTGLPEGIYEYTVTAVDRAGLESRRSDSVTVTVDVTGPLARFQRPSDGNRVGGVVEIKGIAYSQQDFKEYRLYARPVGNPEAVQLLRRSPTPVLNGLLARLSTAGLPENAAFTLRLEAEDLSGNGAAAEITVTVDNQPPAAPAGLVATVNGSDVSLSWNANTEPDLQGYLVFRDGLIANTAGVVTDLTPYILPAPGYVDRARPDGSFRYEIYAIDRAGNLSTPSTPANATVDSRAPRAVIEEPIEGQQFDQPLPVRATTVDQDVSRVQFQYKAAAEVNWHDLGAADTASPWEISWNPAGLPFGDYSLRAVATDVSGRTDPAPPAITVTYTDLTAPARAQDLKAQVHGGDVHLTWNANQEDDLAGYHLDRTDARGARIRLTVAPLTGTAYLDSGLDDGRYAYTVIAVDETGNAADPSEERHALVYTPALEQPYTPTTDTTVEIQGTAAAEATVYGEMTNGSGRIELPAVASDGEGRFGMGPAALERGENSLTLWVVDAENNTSRPAVVTIISSAPPSPPTGLAATAVSEQEVALAWRPNPEPDLLGYRPFRDGEALLADVPLEGLSAEASSEWNPFWGAANVLDSRPFLYWAPLTGNDQPVTGQWLMLSWPEQRIVTQVNLLWYSDQFTEPAGYSVLDYDLEVWDGRAWVKVARVRDNASADNSIALAQPYRTSQLRVLLLRGRFPDTDPEPVRLGRLEISERPYVKTTAFEDRVTDGLYTYTVTALNQYGFESLPSEPAGIAIGDTIPPAPVTLSAVVTGADVELSWTASGSEDVVRYDLYRNGLKFAEHTDLVGLSLTDPNLLNGSYRYTVAAVDGAGNQSIPSNAVEVTVLGDPLPSPSNLTISPVVTGGALDLGWDTEGNATAYRLYRALVAGGPYEPVATTADTHYRDTGLVNGVTYYYVVVAVDAIGNESVPSAEASGTPEDQAGPPAPALHAPGFPGLPAMTTETTAAVTGTAEPGAVVSLFRDEQKIGEALALTETEQRSAYFSEGFRLAPNGRYLWAAPEQILYDYQTDTQRVVPEILGVPHWTKDSRRLFFTDDSGIRAYRLDDDRVEAIIPATNAVAAVPSPEGGRLAVLAEQNGDSGLFVFDLNTSEWDLVSDDSYYRGIDPSTLSWSPDGTRLVYTRSSPSPAIEMVDITRGESQVIATEPGFGAPHWSPDGSALVYTATESGFEQVVRYRVADGDTSILTAAAAGAPQWSPDGRGVAYITEASKVIYQDLNSGETELWFDAEAMSLYGRPLLQWVSGGRLGLFAPYTQERLTPAGHVEFDGIPLSEGDNAFTAIAEDAAGNQSETSEAMIVTVPMGERPDLVLSPADLVVLPAIALVGETVRITVTVRNTGTLVSPEAELVLVVSGPNGFITELTDGPVVGPIVGPIPPGGLQTIVRDFVIPDLAGTYTVVAAVDPFDRLLEMSEANNRAQRELIAAGDSNPMLSVTVARGEYLNDQTVRGTVAVVNPGPPFEGRIELSIEDNQGITVAELPAIAGVQLDFGQDLSETVLWNTGVTFAGDYRLRATLLDERRAAVQTAVAAFTIAEMIELSTEVNTNRAVYPPGAEVLLIGAVRYVTGNTPVSGLVTHFAVLDEAGATLAEFTKALSSLLPGDEATVRLAWTGGPMVPGNYRVVFSVEHDGKVLSTAETVFEVIQETVRLNGTLVLATDSPAVGEPLIVNFALENTGTIPLADLGVSIRLDDGVQGGTIAAENSIVDLGAGERLTGSIEFATQDLALQEYLVVLAAQWSENAQQTESVVLAVASFSLIDRTPPVMRIADPEEGAILRGDPQVVVTAFDGHSAIHAAEIRLDNSGWIRLIPSDSMSNDYVGELTGLVDGPHRLHARATDAWSNIAEAAAIAFEMDNTPPAITVSGVEEGGEYQSAVAPVVSVADAHPKTNELMLNGEPFVSGTIIDEVGLHELQVVALDAVDNRSEVVVRFRILAAMEPVELTIDDVTVTEGDAGTVPAVFALHLSKVSPHVVTVAYRTVDREAVAGEDFVAQSGVVTFEPEQTQQEIAIQILGDSVTEAEETFIVRLESPTGAVLPDSEGIGTIRDDDDVAVLTVSMGDRLVVDNDGDGQLDPGETLGYEVVIANTGDRVLTKLALEDLLPPYTALVPGSLTTSSGEIVAGISPAVRVSVLPPGESVTVSFEVVVDDLVPPGVTRITNQGVVSCTELEPVPTDDPDEPGEADPTVTLLENHSVPVPIPTLNNISLTVLAVLLGMIALLGSNTSSRYFCRLALSAAKPNRLRLKPERPKDPVVYR